MTFGEPKEKPGQNLPVPVEKPPVDATVPARLPMLKEGAGLDQLARKAVEKVAAEKGNGKFIDMILPACLPRVLKMVEESYAAKGAGRSREQFTEDMAHRWLAMREIFHDIGRTAGLQSVNHVDASANTPVIALTVSGSILALTQPLEGGKRGVRYWRISEREDTNVPPETLGRLTDSLSLDARCLVEGVEGHQGMNTSNLMGILANPRAPIDLNQTCHAMSESFVTVGRFVDERGQSVHVQAPKKKT